MRAGDILRDLGRPVSYHAGLARHLGSIPAALMLAQLLYWSDKSEDGWVWKVEADWDEELAFTPDVLKGARGRLLALELIEHKRDGLPAKPYYRVDMEVLDQWWEATFGPDLSVENPRTGRGKIPGQGRGKSPDIPLPALDDLRDDSHRGDATDGFDTFWSTYPSKAKKADAQKAWKKAIKKASANTIIAAAVRYRDDPNREAAYTAYAASWLNSERWNDPPLAPRKNGGGGGARPAYKPSAIDDDRTGGSRVLRSEDL